MKIITNKELELINSFAKMVEEDGLRLIIEITFSDINFKVIRQFPKTKSSVCNFCIWKNNINEIVVPMELYAKKLFERVKKELSKNEK